MYNYTHHYFALNFINPLFLYPLYLLLLLQRQLFLHLLVLLSFLLLSPSYLFHLFVVIVFRLLLHLQLQKLEGLPDLIFSQIVRVRNCKKIILKM